MIDACVVPLRGVYLKNRCYHRLWTIWAVIVVAGDDGVWIDWDRVVVSTLNTIEPILGYSIVIFLLHLTTASYFVGYVVATLKQTCFEWCMM